MFQHISKVIFESTLLLCFHNHGGRLEVQAEGGTISKRMVRFSVWLRKDLKEVGSELCILTSGGRAFQVEGTPGVLATREQ